MNGPIHYIITPFTSEIEDLTTDISNTILTDVLGKRSVTINRDSCPRTVMAIVAILRRLKNLKVKNYTVSESPGGINKAIGNGTYMVPNLKLGDVYITLNSETIEVSTWYSKSISATDIFNFIQEEYNSLFGAINYISYYVINRNARWAFSTTRPLRPSVTMTPVIQDLEYYFDFRHKVPDFKRTGILLHGDPGTGKSTMIEYFASKYLMNVYLVALNCKDLCDADLVQLFMLVPPNSMIVFEEMDSQMEHAENNPNVFITPGGVLSALDGPQRLAYNVFIMITTNNYDNLVNRFPDGALVREGRIDKAFEFTVA